MPVNKHLMDSLVKQYGAKRGKSIYYAMENAGKGPFAKGKKLAKAHDAMVKKRGKGKGGVGSTRTSYGSFNAKHPRHPKGSARGGKFRRK